MLVNGYVSFQSVRKIFHLKPTDSTCFGNEESFDRFFPCTDDGTFTV